MEEHKVYDQHLKENGDLTANGGIVLMDNGIDDEPEDGGINGLTNGDHLESGGGGSGSVVTDEEADPSLPPPPPLSSATTVDHPTLHDHYSDMTVRIGSLDHNGGLQLSPLDMHHPPLLQHHHHLPMQDPGGGGSFMSGGANETSLMMMVPATTSAGDMSEYAQLHPHNSHNHHQPLVVGGNGFQNHHHHLDGGHDTAFRQRHHSDLKLPTAKERHSYLRKYARKLGLNDRGCYVACALAALAFFFLVIIMAMAASWPGKNTQTIPKSRPEFV